MRVDTSIYRDAIAESDSRAVIAPAGPPVPGLVWAFRIYSDATPGNARRRPTGPVFHVTGCFGCISTWPTPAAAVADIGQPPAFRLTRALLLSKDTYQQLLHSR